MAALRVLGRLAVLVEMQRKLLWVSLRSSCQRQVDDPCNGRDVTHREITHTSNMFGMRCSPLKKRACHELVADDRHVEVRRHLLEKR